MSATSLVVVAAVAAVGRTQLSFVIALLLAAPTLLFQLLAIDGGDSRFLLHSWAFGAALYASTIGYLLRYVFQRDVMTADKLYGAAAAYLMLGVLWGYLYAIANHLQPGSFAFGGSRRFAADRRPALFQFHRTDQHRLRRRRAAAALRARAVRARAAGGRALPGDPDRPPGRRLSAAQRASRHVVVGHA